MNAADLNTQLVEAADATRKAQADLEQRAVNYARAEQKYRMAKATAYLSTHGTVAEREAHAESAINDLRYERDLADGLKVSALEAVRSNRGILSAIQTLAGLYKAEAEFDRTGSHEQPQWGSVSVNHDEVKSLLEELFACYPNAPVPSRRIVQAWAPHLRDVEFIDAREGGRLLVERSRFVPVLAEVLEVARAARRDRLGVVGPSDREVDDTPEGGWLTLAEWKQGREVSGQ